MFSLRIVTSDHYMAPPLRNVDVVFSEFRQTEVKRVPVFRIFGSSAAGQKTCMHVHGVFPYLYVPYDGTQPWNLYIYQFASSLDKALNIALGNEHSKVQHVYKVSLVSGIPMYGYHDKEQQFLKIYLYNPNLVRRVADLLVGGGLMNKVFQPHESHIPYNLQLFIDYNLYGMNMINVAAVKFRQWNDNDDSLEKSPRALLRKSISDPLNQSILEGMSETNTPTLKHWHPHNTPNEMMMGADVPRVSTCELEVDVVAADILNKQEVHDNLGNNPGLMALWEDERERKRDRGESIQITPPSSPVRESVEVAESQHNMKERLLEILTEQQPYLDSQSSESSEALPVDNDDNADTSICTPASTIEDHLSQLQDSELSSQGTVIFDEEEEEERDGRLAALVNRDSISRVVLSSQSFVQQDSTPSDEHNDQSLVEMLVALVEENSLEASQALGSQVTALEEQDSILCGTPGARDDDKIAEDEEEEAEMSQSIWETDLPCAEDENKDSHCSTDHDIKGFEQSWTESQFLDNIPQLDGPMDEKPVANTSIRKRLGVHGPVISQSYQPPQQTDVQSAYHIPTEEPDEQFAEDSCTTSSWSNQEESTDTMWYSSLPKVSQHLSPWEQQFTGSISPPIPQSPQANPAMSPNQFHNQDYFNMARSQQLSSPQDSQFCSPLDLKQNQHGSQFDYRNNNSDQSSHISSFMNGSLSPVHNTNCPTSAGISQNTYHRDSPLGSPSSYQQPSPGSYTGARPDPSPCSPSSFQQPSPRSYTGARPDPSPCSPSSFQQPSPGSYTGAGPAPSPCSPSSYQQPSPGSYTGARPTLSPSMANPFHCSANSYQNINTYHSPTLRHQLMSPTSPHIGSSQISPSWKTTSGYHQEFRQTPDPPSPIHSPIHSPTSFQHCDPFNNPNQRPWQYKHSYQHNTPPLPMHGIPCNSPELRSNFDNTVKRSLSTSFDSQEDLFADSASIRSRPLSSSSVGSKSSVCSDTSYEMSSMYREPGVSNPPVNWHQQMPTPHGGPSVISSLENFVSTVSKNESYGATFSQQYGQRQFTSQNPSSYTPQGHTSHSVPLPVSDYNLCNDRNFYVTPITQHPEHGYRRTISDNGMSFSSPCLQNKSLKGTAATGKAGRMKKLGFAVNRRHSVASESPSKKPSSYSYTFNVPSPVYKRLKLQPACSFSAKSDIARVNMHPMDARRYSLLKIGCELVKTKRLTLSNMCQINEGLKPKFVNTDQIKFHDVDRTTSHKAHKKPRKRHVPKKFKRNNKNSLSSKIFEIGETEKNTHCKEVKREPVTEVFCTEPVTEVFCTNQTNRAGDIHSLMNSPVTSGPCERKNKRYKRKSEMELLLEITGPDGTICATRGSNLKKTKLTVKTECEMTASNVVSEVENRDIHKRELDASEVSKVSNPDTVLSAESQSVINEEVTVTDSATHDKHNCQTKNVECEISNVSLPAVCVSEDVSEHDSEHDSNLENKTIDFEDKTAEDIYDSCSQALCAISNSVALPSSNNKNIDNTCHLDGEKTCSDITSEPLASHCEEISQTPSTIKETTLLNEPTSDNPEISEENCQRNDLIGEGGSNPISNLKVQNSFQLSEVSKPKNTPITGSKNYPDDEKYPSFSVYGGNLPPSMAMYAGVEPISSEEEVSDSESKVCAYVTSNMTVSPFTQLYGPGIKNERYFSQIEKASLGYRNGETELTKLSPETFHRPFDCNIMDQTPDSCGSQNETREFYDKKMSGFQQVFLQNLQVKDFKENVEQMEKTPQSNCDSKPVSLNVTSVASDNPEKVVVEPLSLCHNPSMSCVQDTGQSATRIRSSLRRRLSLKRKTRQKKTRASDEDELDNMFDLRRNYADLTENRSKRSSANYGRNAFSHLLETENVIETDEDMSHRKARASRKGKLKEGVHYIIIGKFKGYKRMLVKICNSQVHGDFVSVKDFLEAMKLCRICNSVQKSQIFSKASNQAEGLDDNKSTELTNISSTFPDAEPVQLTNETVPDAEPQQLTAEFSSKLIQTVDSTSTSTSNSDSNIENDPELKDDSSCDAVYGRNRPKNRRKALTRNQRLGVAFVTKRTKRKRPGTPTCVMNSLSILHQATLASLSDILACTDKCDGHKVPTEDVMQKLAFTSPPTSDPGEMSPPVPISPQQIPNVSSEARRRTSMDLSIGPSLCKESMSVSKPTDCVNDVLPHIRKRMRDNTSLVTTSNDLDQENQTSDMSKIPNIFTAIKVQKISPNLKSSSLMLGKIMLKTPTKYVKSEIPLVEPYNKHSDEKLDDIVTPASDGCSISEEDNTNSDLEDSQSQIAQISQISPYGETEKLFAEKSKLRKEGFVKMLDFSRNVNHVKEITDSTCVVESDSLEDLVSTSPQLVQETAVETSDVLTNLSQEVKCKSKYDSAKKSACRDRPECSSQLKTKLTEFVKKPVEYLETGLSAKDLMLLTNSKRLRTAPAPKNTLHNHNPENGNTQMSPWTAPSSQPADLSINDSDIHLSSSPNSQFDQQESHVQNDLSIKDINGSINATDGIMKNFPKSVVSMTSSCKMVVAPLIPPPSLENIRDTAPEFNIPLYKPTEPFCSIQADVPEKTREIGGRVLKLNGTTVNDLLEFRSESSGCGLKMWRSILTLDDPFLSQNLHSDFIKQLEMEHELRYAVIGDHSKVICPCLPPPSARTVNKWLKNKKKTEKDFVSDKVCKPMCDTEVLTSTVSSKNTNLNTNFDLFQKHKPAGEVSMLDDSGESDFNKKDINGAQKSKEDFSTPTNFPNSELLFTPVKVLAFDDVESPPHSTPVQRTASSALSKLTCTPIQSSQPLRKEPKPYEVPKKCPPRRRLSTNTDKSLRKSLLASQISNMATPSTSKADTSQIDGPTPKNTFGFRFSQNNAPDSKALHEVQYLTILSVELHVETRGDRKPDPEQDPICALFYCIKNDVPGGKGQTEVSGVIVINEASAASVNSISLKPSDQNSTVSDSIKCTPTLKGGKQSGSVSPQPSTSKERLESQKPSTSTHQPSHHQPVQGTANEIKDTLFQQSGVAGLVTTYVQNEQNLCQAFLKLIQRWDPDILVGYEIQMLSLGYLLNRASHLGIDLCAQISRVPDCKRENHIASEKDEYGADHNSEIHVSGRIVLNLWRIMKHEVTLNLYSFENVSFHVLHERLPNYSYRSLTNWFNHRTHLYRWRVVDYYTKRAKGNLELMEQLNLIGRTSEFARVFGIEFFHVLSRGSQYRVESMMLRLAKPLNFIPVSPNVQQRARMKAPECIPLTLEPESRFYTHPVVVVDFQSLYPSIMIAYNYCFSTCLGRLTNLAKAQDGAIEFGCTNLSVKPSLLRKLKDDVTISPNGVVFVKEHVRKGVISSMVEEILNTRIMVKREMKAYKDDKGLSRLLHARQLGLKLIANVTYGYTGANFSGRMPCIEVGDSIVRKARETLERAIKLVENTPRWRAKVVYGDTDSMFIELKGRTKDEAFKIGYEIAEAVTAMNPKPIKLKFEKVYLPCVLQTKKRYFGYMYETPDQQEPVFDAKGVETVRRDNCPAVSKVLERCIKILFTTRNVSQIKQYVIKQCTKLLQGRVSLQDCIFAKEYRGMPGYKPGACVPALEIAKKRLRHDRRSEPRVGERVPYVIVYGSPGLPLIQLVRQPSELLLDSSLRLNTTYYITKQILPPLQRFLALIGVDVFSWYQEMPRIVMPVGHIPGETRKGTISQYFSVTNCPLCDEQTKDQLCVKCQSSPQLVTCDLNERMRQWEKSYQNLLTVCGNCMGVSETNPSCISLDCPVLYRLNRAKLDTHKTEHLREVIKDML